MTNKHRYGWLLCGHRCALMGCFTAALTGVNDIGSGLSSREPTAGVSGQRTVVRQKNKDKREGEIWGNGDKMDGNASGQAKTKSIHIKMQDHTHTHTHTYAHAVIHADRVGLQQGSVLTRRPQGKPDRIFKTGLPNPFS